MSEHPGYKSDSVNGGRIISKSYKGGNEKEATWPPLFGNPKSGVYYRDSETGEIKEGYPPPKVEKFGEAPMIIDDTLKKPHYHHGACMWTDSRKGIEVMDKATGCVTTGTGIKNDGSATKRRIKERHDDLHRSMHRAVAQIDAGTAPLTEETKKLCEIQNEITSKALNFDAFNVAGRKTHVKGKLYRKRWRR
jgi:hypothetical protein